MTVAYSNIVGLNNNVNTLYANSGVPTGNSPAGNYIVWNLGFSRALGSFRIEQLLPSYSGPQSYYLVGKIGLQFYGSTDNFNWNLVYSNPLFSSGQEYFNTGSTTPYQYYAMVVTYYSGDLYTYINMIPSIYEYANGSGGYGYGTIGTLYGGAFAAASGGWWLGWNPTSYVYPGQGYGNSSPAQGTYTGSVSLNLGSTLVPVTTINSRLSASEANITALQLKTSFSSLNSTGTLGVSGVSTLAGVTAANVNVTGALNVSGAVTVGNVLSVVGPGTDDASNLLAVRNNALNFGRNEISLIGRAQLHSGSINDAWSFVGPRNALSFSNQTSLNAAVDRRYVVQCNGLTNQLGLLTAGQGNAPVATWDNNGLMSINNGVNVSGAMNTASIISLGNVSGLSLNAGASGLSVAGSSSLAGVSASYLAVTGNVSGLSLNAGASGLSVAGSSSLAGVSASSLTVTNATGISGQGVVDINVTALGGANTYVNGAYSKVTIDSAFGGVTAADISTVQASRARVIGNNITNAGINISAIRADYKVTGTNAAQMKTAVLASIQPGTNTADAAVIAYIEGDDGVSHADAAYAVRMANSTPGSGFGLGLDLTMPNIVNGKNGNTPNVPFDTADIRLNNGLLVKSLNVTVTNNMTSSLVNGGIAIPAGSLVLTNVTAVDQSNMFLSVYNTTAGTTLLRQIALV